ncbi:efflux RND transporter permease subunit [Litorilinea aerophila]|uniref:Efflux RND transporter permease subunit n=1 Tax=Litorilinea aerophila TaxID=1204385 RepID=A0A540V8J5_9CHLR|nr:efflux RND transporter permease subunit [Litorilinea aerophila]MCC9078964.1 efflux RND transporter permease subunit [Litorilinea aerophila]
MMRWLIGVSLRLRFLILVFAAVLLLGGIVQLREMPIDIYPEFDPPLVEVQTEALGLSAEEMEALITVPLEADLLNGVAWLDQIYSESVAGMSSILLVFEPGTDPIRARQMVQERLTQTFALPNVSSPPTMLQPLSTSSRVMMVGLSSNQLSLVQMGVLARWNIKPRLMGVPGVANVAIWGHRDRQLQVLIDPATLQEKGVTIQQIIETTGEALWVSPLSYLESSTPGTAGWIDTPNQRLSIRHELPISSAEDLGKVAVVDHEGLLLEDVARVVEDHQPLIGDALLDEGPGLLLVIEKFPGANTLEVTRGVEEALAAMRPGLTGIEIDTTIFRPATYLEQAARNVSVLLLIGIVLLALVLGAFFFQWRTALASLIVIPLSLAAAGLILYLRGTTFNAMTLAGFVVALGAIIDNAVVDTENIARRVHQHRQSGDAGARLPVVLEATLEMRGPLIFALLIILAAVAPIFLIPGLAGSFIRPLTVSFILALLTSLGVALLITPALTMLLLSDLGRTTVRPTFASPVVQRLQERYRRLLSQTVRARYLGFGLAAVLILAGLIALPFLDVSLVPTFKQTDLTIYWKAAPGTSRAEMSRITAQVRQELHAIPGVESFGTHMGRAITGDAIVDVDSGEIWVSISPEVNYEATVAAIRNVTSGYPGLISEVRTYEPKRMKEALLGPGHDLVVRLYGHDLELLNTQAEKVQQAIANINGIARADVDRQNVRPQVEIEVRLPEAERYQVKPGDVRRQATTLISGLRVGNLYEENKVFDVVVWGEPQLRDSLTDLHALPIYTSRGYVPLQELADVRIVPSPTVIRRDVVSRFVDVGIAVEGRNPAVVAADIRDRIKGMEFPLEYHAEVLGASDVEQITWRRLWGMVLAAAVGIFLLMQAAFNSWRMALVTFVTLPMALAGGVLAALLGGGALSLGALFAFLTVLGLAVRQVMVLIRHLQNLEDQEGEPFGPELVLRGARERLAPILMTSLGTIVLMLPFVLAGDIAGNEVIRPMAIVILGGTITSMLFSLVVIPNLYLRYGARPEPVQAAARWQEQPGYNA